MSKVKVAAFSISLDGFGAGPRQDINNPLGVRGLELHNWVFLTEAFKKVHSQSGDTSPGAFSGTTGVDNDFAAQSSENIGAWILGRNMFGPVRGRWSAPAQDDPWRGWWGDNPPYHTPVFVLTHHARPPLAMEGGTTFHFVTDGLDSALRQAKEAAQSQSKDKSKDKDKEGSNKGKDVRIGGGVSVIREFLLAGHIDEMHLAMSPVLLGEGENLFAGINLAQLGFIPSRIVAGENATHILIKKT
jgi:dihydrofolate reductase